ncbi:SigB/SigF/SigG family RNA polymerase sigma factor [Streptomyces sp. NPDC058739]|uniref:SigB/SigF/SigG family RNA polymerase sigma factor n=1 Tax=Streptomyces sp. NPDC058739 TaxID=3346618 RepID=UPI00368229A7
MRVTATTKQHPHDDAPDTAAAFDRLHRLPDGPERRQLRNELVSAWLPMAERIAMRFRNRGENVEDLYQVAAVGLVKAVNHYDPERGRAFAVYAIPTITGELKRHFRDHLWTLHVPRRAQELRNQVRRAVRELSQITGGAVPALDEIVRHTGLTDHEVRTGLDAVDCFTALSLDAELPRTDGYSLASAIGAPDPGYDQVVDREAVKPCIQALPEREQTLLYLRFFQGMTQSAIAEQLGISQMHVSRLLSTCLAHLREELLAEAG